MKKQNLPLRAFVLLMLVLAIPAMSCSLVTGRGPAATPTAARPTDTIVPTVAGREVTITPTLAQATSTATPTPAVTKTKTPKPTATPHGYYNNFNGGYSLNFPEFWKIVSEKNGELWLEDAPNEFTFLAFSRAEEKPLDEEQFEEDLGSFTNENNKLTVEYQEEVDLADGVKALKLETMVTGPQTRFHMWAVYAHQNKRGYTFLFLASTDLADFQDEIDQVLPSIRLFTPQLYGLPHDQTLIMLGFDPIDDDLDPATTTSSAADYIGLLFSGLVRMTPDLQVVPELAQEWNISEDGTVYTFTLREGIKFSSGKEITAKDVKESWERACDPRTKSTTAATYLGDISGVKAKLAGESKEIEGLKVIDERTLQVTLDGPKPYFLSKLTYPTAYVLDSQLAGRAWIHKPNSSGPYIVRRYVKGEAFVFARNPEYWRPAGVEYLVYLFEPGGSPMSLYEEGTIDILPLGTTDRNRISKPDDPLHDEMLTMPSLCTSFLFLNANQPPLDDPLVRKALLMATDRATLMEKLTENTAMLDDSILPPAMPGYLDSRSLPGFDPQAAQEALAQSKYAGQAINITFSTRGYGNADEPLLTMLADMWKTNLGINVKVEYLDPENFSEAAGKKTDMQVIDYGWCADYPDPENFLDVLFHTGSDFNVGHVSVPELDALVEQARVEPDPAKRVALYQQAEDLLLNEVHAIPLFHHVGAVLVKPRVQGYVLSPMNALILPFLTIEEVE